jgi:predicted Zn-dependent protease
MKVLGGVALESFGVPGGQTVSDLTFTSIETKYSRDQERQADYLGVVWAVEAGYEPDGAVRLHEKIHERSKSGPLPFLSSHPSGPERISTLKSLSERLSK